MRLQLPPLRASGSDLAVTLTGDGLSKLFAVATNLLVVKLAAASQMGVFSFFLATMNILWLLSDLGLNLSLVNYVAANREHPARGLAFLKAGLALKGLLLVLVIVPCFLLASWLFGRLPDSESYPAAARLACLGAVGMALVNFASATFQGQERFRSLAAIRISEGLGRFLLVGGLVLLWRFDLFGVLLCFALAPMLVGAAGMLGPLARLRAAVFRRDTARDLIRFSRWIALSTVAGSLALQLDMLLLAALSTREVLGVYGAAQRLAVPLVLLMNSILTVLLPKAVAQRDAASLRAFSRRSLKLTGPLAALSLLLVFAGAPLIERFFPQYEGATALFQILGAGVALSLVFNPSSLLLYGLGRPDLVAWVSVGQLVFNVSGILVLVPRFGATGAALSTALTWLLGGLAWWLLARRSLAARARLESEASGPAAGEGSIREVASAGLEAGDSREGAGRAAPDGQPLLSVVMITLNSAERLRQVLASVAWADEIIVVDAGSDDATLDIARAQGARVCERSFTDFADQKNAALALAKGDWVLAIDADEIVTPALAAQIRATLAAPGPCGAFEIPFRNYLGGRWLRHGGLYPDYHTRLFRRAGARFERPIHETVRIAGPLGRLSEPIDHFSYRDPAHLWQKVRRYAARDAAYHARAGSSPWLLLLKVPWRFVSTYLLKSGFRDGRLGLLNAVALTGYAWLLFRDTARIQWRR
jgi:O-antigen/teichoic acid export membrane protein